MPYYANAAPGEIEPQEDYSLRALAAIFDCQPATLRKAIDEGALKARRRGRIWVVAGKDALRWWKSDGNSRQ